MPMPMLAPLTVARLFGHWALHPASAIASAVLVLGYLGCVAAVRRRGTHWPVVRSACWLAGVAVLVFTTQGGIAAYSDALFWMHMVEHLLLIMVVPLGLIGGRPWDLLLAVTSGRAAGPLRGPVVSLLTHPLVTLALYTAAIAGTHLTGFMNSLMMHAWLHGLESAVYVVAGFLFFTPLVSDAPIRWRLSQPMRMMVLVVAMPVDTFTGVILGQTTVYPWPMMAMMHPAWGPSLIDDLHAGGAVMWIGGDAIMAVLMGVAAVAWARAAASGDGSELGGWLSAARVNYQRSVATGAPVDPAGPAVRTGDSDDDLADYNAYLQRLNRAQR
jgi:putative copper resistance protein D